MWCGDAYSAAYRDINFNFVASVIFTSRFMKIEGIFSSGSDSVEDSVCHIQQPISFLYWSHWITKPLATSAESDDVQLMTGRAIAARFLLPVHIRQMLLPPDRKEAIHVRLQAIISQCFITAWHRYKHRYLRLINREAQTKLVAPTFYYPLLYIPSCLVVLSLPPVMPLPPQRAVVALPFKRILILFSAVNIFERGRAKPSTTNKRCISIQRTASPQ